MINFRKNIERGIEIYSNNFQQKTHEKQQATIAAKRLGTLKSVCKVKLSHPLYPTEQGWFTTKLARELGSTFFDICLIYQHCFRGKGGQK